MSRARRRTPALVAMAVSLLVLAASCSDTGLSGQVTTTTKASDGPTTTLPTTTAPSDSGSTGGGSSGGGSGGGSSGPSDEPEGFLVYQDASTPSALWTVDADGGNRKTLPAVDGQVLSSPLLSGSANELAFLATPVTPPGATAPPGPPKLWIASAQGEDAKPLTTDAVADTCFTWSPDGNSLLSTTTDPATGKGVARSLAIDGATPPAPVAVDLPAGSCPIYLDQDTLAFISSSPPLAGGPPARNDRVATARPDGQLSTLEATLPGCTLTDLRGVPTSGVVSVSAACDDVATSGIYLLVVAEGQPANPQLILPNAAGPIAFAPDGGWIAYTRADPEDPATAEILITKLDGSEARRLVAPTTSSPTWQSTDGGGGAASNA